MALFLFILGIVLALCGFALLVMVLRHRSHGISLRTDKDSTRTLTIVAIALLFVGAWIIWSYVSGNWWPLPKG